MTQRLSGLTARMVVALASLTLLLGLGIAFAQIAKADSGPYAFCSRSYPPYDSCEDSNAHTITQGKHYGQYSQCFRVDASLDPTYFCGNSGDGVLYPDTLHGYPECHEHSGLEQGMHCDFWTT